MLHQKKSSSISQINHNNSNLTHPTEIANTFNNFFVNVGHNCEREIPKSHKKPTSYMGERNQNDFLFTILLQRKLVMKSLTENYYTVFHASAIFQVIVGVSCFFTQVKKYLPECYIEKS